MAEFLRAFLSFRLGGFERFLDAVITPAFRANRRIGRPWFLLRMTAVGTGHRKFVAWRRWHLGDG